MTCCVDLVVLGKNKIYTQNLYLYVERENIERLFKIKRLLLLQRTQVQFPAPIQSSSQT